MRQEDSDATDADTNCHWRLPVGLEHHDHDLRDVSSVQVGCMKTKRVRLAAGMRMAYDTTVSATVASIDMEQLAVTRFGYPERPVSSSAHEWRTPIRDAENIDR